MYIVNAQNALIHEREASTQIVYYLISFLPVSHMLNTIQCYTVCSVLGIAEQHDIALWYYHSLGIFFSIFMAFVPHFMGEHLMRDSNNVSTVDTDTHTHTYAGSKSNRSLYRQDP